MSEGTLEKLTSLGLDTNEAKVYLALLELGQANVAEISQKAGLNRTTAYDILDRLGLSGLVGRTRVGKKRLFVANPPSHLQQYVLDKKRAAERRVDEVKDLLPELQSLFKTDLKPSLQFAEGRAAIEQMYNHQLEAKEDVYSILELKGYAENYDEMGKRLSTERMKKGIKQKVLARKNDVALAWWEDVYKGQKRRQEFTEYKWMKEEKNLSPAAEIMVFDDKVIGLLVKPGENAAFEIQSQSFADSLKGIFELAWQNAAKNPKSID